jgi:CysZ protein
VRGIRGPVGGFRTLLQGLGMLVRERRLWLLASVPVGFALVALVVASVLIFENASDLYTLLTGWLPLYQAGSWYTWIWIGPLKLIVASFGYLLFLLFSGFLLLLSLLVANVASAPFLDALSQRVERIELGEAFDFGEAGLAAIWGEARRSVAHEAQRLLFFVGVWGVIALGGVVIPGGQLLAPPLLLVFTALFLPLDYAGYSLDRRHVSFAHRRSWVRANLAVMLGFGGGAVAISLVPVLNFLLLPSLVVAGTLLALRCPPDVGFERPDP